MEQRSVQINGNHDMSSQGIDCVKIGDKSLPGQAGHISNPRGQNKKTQRVRLGESVCVTRSGGKSTPIRGRAMVTVENTHVPATENKKTTQQIGLGRTQGTMGDIVTAGQMPQTP